VGKSFSVMAEAIDFGRLARTLMKRCERQARYETALKRF
jgi:hypothetical protein